MFTASNEPYELCISKSQKQFEADEIYEYDCECEHFEMI